MNKKILALSLVLALVAVMVIPMATFAAPVTTPITITASLTATATPTITTPVYAHATSVSGTAVANAHMSLTVTGNAQGPITADANGSGAWTITVTSLTAGDVIHVTAQLNPDTVSAEQTATVTATSATLTVPGTFGWDTTFQVGDIQGHAAAAGTVVSVAETWSLTVADNNAGTGTGHMVKGSTPLFNALQVDTAAISSDSIADTIANYNTPALMTSR